MITCDDIADRLVDYYNDYFYGTGDPVTPVINFTPVNPTLTPEVEVEEGTFVVFVFPTDESEEPANHDGTVTKEKLSVGIYVVGPIDDTITKKIALEFTKQLRIALRGTVLEFDDEPDYEWMSTDVPYLYNLDALKKGEFISAFEATYYTIV